MRIRLVLYNKVANAGIPINYNHFLAAAIYRILRERSLGTPTLPTKMAGQETRRRFKMFTFSHLKFESYRIEQERISFDEGHIHWYISSPVNSFLIEIAQRAAKLNTLLLAGARFEIDKVEILKEVNFSREMNFAAISPITVTANPNNPNPHYIRHTELGFAEAVRDNLIKKHMIIYNTNPKDDTLSFTFDQEYVRKRAGKIQKKINFLSMEIIGFIAPFKVKGSPELIKLGYDAGFGEKGNMGFGMVKEIKK
ncbi:CRISPR-associated protein Cas6 [Candidatus Magnetobacterium bavaricum]|uniref:CRISPR-associated endoribonuclease n=1 Tax=Candidatus Magnetobacterium bavaricum TaxID=29290 RepID=A0A0F3GN98_9BACT|nr:CRISPR-associated protein Cas6 [Candidatus Magnetobacterium bavaricum]